MTHTYRIEGITCNGCVAKVKSKLLGNPDIEFAEVSLEGQKAVIGMRRQLSLKDLQVSIGTDTKYTIVEDHTQPAAVLNAAPASFFQTYKPLLVIAAFLALVSSLTANGIVTMGMNHFMAGFFLVFSFFKLLDLKGFASSYAMYDILAMRVNAWGFIYPFVELALGLLYLTGVEHSLTIWATIIVMGFSSIGVIRSVIKKQAIRCACLGAVFNLPMSTVTIIEDLAMVAMAAAMLL